MPKLLLAAVVLSAILAVTPSAPSRSDAANCTADASPANAQSRIDSARAGDVVCLGAGTFRGPLLVYGKSSITLRGAGPHVTVVAGGSADPVVIINSDSITVEDMTLYEGALANVYARRSTNVNLQRLDIGGGGIGVHADDASSVRVGDSFIYAQRGDGVLVRNNAGVTLERNWIFYNGGVGASFVGHTAPSTLTRNIISDHRGPGIFAGMPPCAGLPGASLAVPPCFFANPGAYVGSAALTLDTNIIQASGSTGIVLFPGTSATMRGNRIWHNSMTGLFGWGATISSDFDEYDGNDEHALELRSYPDPRNGAYIGAGGRINGAIIRNSLVWPGSGTLGGGIIAQGAALDVTGSTIYRNAGIGVSYQNGSRGRVEGNTITENGGGAICLFSAGAVATGNNTIWGNATDRVGSC